MFTPVFTKDLAEWALVVAVMAGALSAGPLMFALAVVLGGLTAYWLHLRGGPAEEEPEGWKLDQRVVVHPEGAPAFLAYIRVVEGPHVSVESGGHTRDLKWVSEGTFEMENGLTVTLEPV